MGKITSALRKAAEERFNRIEKVTKIKEQSRLIIKKIGDSKVNSNIVSYFDPKGLITEQYKILRTNILSMNKGNPPKAIMMTSSLHSEGKTVTAINLAVSLAQAIHKPKVLIVDADLRRGKVARYLGVDHEQAGLTELLSGEATFENVAYNIDIENLTIINSGKVPENPAEL